MFPVAGKSPVALPLPNTEWRRVNIQEAVVAWWNAAGRRLRQSALPTFERDDDDVMVHFLSLDARAHESVADRHVKLALKKLKDKYSKHMVDWVVTARLQRGSGWPGRLCDIRWDLSKRGGKAQKVPRAQIQEILKAADLPFERAEST